MRTYTPAELADILRAHRDWRCARAGGARADLSGANLSGADLRGADLSGANLYGAALRGADLPDFSVCPEAGSFTAFKKLRGGVIATLEIPAEARRTSSLVGRKCRAEFARVLALSTGERSGYSMHDDAFVYRVGEIVRPDAYDDDIRVECAPGIHFFISRREAERY